MAEESAMPGRRAALPAGLAPRYLSRTEAAAYLGVSVETFDEEVRSGQWPPARRRGAKGSRVTWDRVLLDAFADRDSGLVEAEGLRASVVAGDELAAPDQTQAVAEAAALQGVLNAQARHRVKHRQSKAA